MWLLLAAAACFFAGLLLPAYTIDPTTGSFWMDAVLGALGNSLEPQTKSLASTVGLLLSAGDATKVFLGVLIGAFTIGFPTLKLVLLARIALRRKEDELTKKLLGLGYWSMVDVFVIAVLLLSLTPTLTVRPEIGLVAFALSVILTRFAHKSLIHS